MAEWVDIPGAIRVADPAGLLADCDCPERGFYLWCSFQVHGRKVLRWRPAVKALPSVILLTQRFGVT